MAQDSLTTKTKNGFLWSAIETFSGQAIQFAISIVLARLLMPSDFGIIGMLTIFLAFSDSIIDSGFGNALIQKRERTQIDYSTIFYFNVLIAVLFYIILYLGAPYIALFYEMPILEPVTKVVSLRLIFGALMLVQNTKLQLELRFKLLTKIRLATSVFTGLVGIGLAYLGYGVWALVFQMLFSQVFQVILLWSLSRWSPSCVFSIESLKTLFGFGSKLLITGLYGPIFDNLNTLIIGKFYSPSQLGLYTRSNTLVKLPSASITQIINRVSYPVLCSISDEDNRLVVAYRKLIKETYFIVFPIMMGLLVASKPLVLFLLTEKWIECVPYIQVLCVAMSLYPICAYNINLLLVKGHSEVHMKLDLVKKIFTVIVLAITASISVSAICFGSVLTSLFSWIITAYYSGRYLDLSLSKQIKDIQTSFIITILMCLFIYPITLAKLNCGLILVLQIFTGVVLYFLLSRNFNRECYSNFIKLLKRNK